MSCGVPVVATRVGAFEDLIADGATGLLVAREDLAGLRDATGRLLSDPDLRERFAEAARPHVEVNFRIEGEAAALIAIYRQLLSAP